MGWKDLLQKKDEEIVLPWLGGRVLQFGVRSWKIQRKLPDEFGWYRFKIDGRDATLMGNSDPAECLTNKVRGYLVGDRLVIDGSNVDPDPAKIINFSESVMLIEPGLDRFARISAGRSFENGPLIYSSQEFPLGPEDEVVAAFQDKKESVSHIKGVPPALDAAFRMDSWQRVEAVKRRLELERLRKEEEARKALEERRRQIAETLGDGVGRRAIAQLDFPEAAKAALAVGGAEYLDSRASRQKNEMGVTFRLLNRRFECTCDKYTLRIVDSGICLVNHGTNERGDDRFTLESLPAVIQEAHRDRKLHVFRHVDYEDDDDGYDD